MMKKFVYLLMFVPLCFQAHACFPDNREKPEDNANQNKEEMKLKITIGNKTAMAVLYDNATGRDFATRLPLTVEMDDYSNTEKIFYPKPKLSTVGAPSGFDPSVGDLTVYAPWGNVALFYKDFGYSSGLVSFGKITSGAEHFKVKGSISVKFELIKE